MRNVCLIYWAAISVSVALTSCEKPKSTAETGPPEVLVTEVIQRGVPIIRESVGTLNEVQNAQVCARVTGYIQKIAYQQGGYVKKGDLLFEIDPRSIIAALDQAKAQLQEAQATSLQVELDAKRAKRENRMSVQATVEIQGPSEKRVNFFVRITAAPSPATVDWRICFRRRV